MKQNYPLSRKDNLVVQNLEEETLIYDLKIDKAYCLNKTSAVVWQLCDGNRSISEISQALGKELKVPVSEELVWLTLDQLKKEQLLENEASVNPSFQDLSRRDVIKKIGFASMVALPVIMHVTAPVAADAQSGICVAVTGLDSCFCPESFCDGQPLGTIVPPGSSTCQDGCISSGSCTCRGPYICNQTVPGFGGKQGTCQF